MHILKKDLSMFEQTILCNFFIKKRKYANYKNLILKYINNSNYIFLKKIQSISKF